MGSPALIRRQSRNLNHRPDFDGALARPWDACRYADGLVEILRIDQEVAAELFAGLRERTVGDQPFAVAHLDAGGRRHRLQRGRGQILSVRLELVRELGRLRETVLPL